MWNREVCYFLDKYNYIVFAESRESITTANPTKIIIMSMTHFYLSARSKVSFDICK